MLQTTDLRNTHEFKVQFQIQWPLNEFLRTETLSVITDEGHLFGETLSTALHLATGNTLNHTFIHLLISNAVMQHAPRHTGASNTFHY